MERRQFIVAAGAATVIGLSGCLGDSDADTSSPEGVVESWYRLYETADSEDEYIDAATDLLHSQSPWHELFEFAREFDEETDEDIEEIEIERLDVTVIEENLDEAAIQQHLGFFDVEEDVIAAVAASNNAIVEAEVELSNGEREEAEHLVAEEDGEWLIFV